VNTVQVHTAYECHRVKVLIYGWPCLRLKGILVSSLLALALMHVFMSAAAGCKKMLQALALRNYMLFYILFYLVGL